MYQHVLLIAAIKGSNLRTCVLSVIFPATMGWTRACQKRIYDEYTIQEWANWIFRMEDVGWGRLTKDEWRDWVHQMMEEHGLPRKGWRSSSSSRPPPPPPPAQGDFCARTFFRHPPPFDRDCGTARIFAPPDITQLGVAVYQGNPLPSDNVLADTVELVEDSPAEHEEENTSEQPDLADERPSFAELLETIAKTELTFVEERVVPISQVNSLFEHCPEEEMESSPSQGPPAKGKGKRRRVVKAQDDVTDSDDEPGINFREFTGFAACQNCGERWVCDGRVDTTNHTHPIPAARLTTFVCPFDSCSANDQ